MEDRTGGVGDRSLSREQAADAARHMEAILRAIDMGELTASSSERAYLAGAIEVLKRLGA